MEGCDEEYLEVIYSRYRREDPREKQVILNDFCRNTGYNRKYAIRLLKGPPPSPRRERSRPRHRSPTYSAGVIAILGAVWEAAGLPCGVRLRALLPLLRISVRQFDRRLEERKERVGRRLYGRAKPGTLLQHLIPLRTDHWQVKMSGLAEVDLVSHSGSSGRVRLRAQSDRCAPRVVAEW